MRRLIHLSIALTLLGLASSASAVDSLWNTERLKIAYQDLGPWQREEFHLSLLEVLNQQAKETTYEQEKINVYLTNNSYPLLESLFSEAYATIDDPTIFCHFGGWLTTIKNSKCVAPWSRSVRNNPEMEIFGGSYKHSCGGKNLFRCNPLIFGPGKDGKGICTSTKDSDPKLSTQSCIEDFTKNPDNVLKHLDTLSKDPEMLSQYLAITAETLRSCEVQSTAFSYCEKLKRLIESTAKAAVQCSVEEDLITYLPDIITPFNQDEIDRITSGLGEKAIKYIEELEKKQEEVRKHNRSVLEQAISNAANESRMKATIKRIRENASMCLRGLCAKTRYSNKKPATRSIAKCAAYVKHAIYPYPSEEGDRYANFSEYPWGHDADDAVESGNWLKKHGFENILDYPEMSHLTPENAPPGAIIVYEKINSGRKTNVDGQRRGAPGHIEIKASRNEYISDFINDEPTRVGGLRRPIAIYYQVPDSYKKQLQEVPQ